MDCRVTSCKEPGVAKNLCASHYKKVKRYGSVRSPLSLREKLAKAKKSFCPKCNKIKKIKEFYQDKSTAWGWSTYCKLCISMLSKSKRSRYKDRLSNSYLNKLYGISLKEYNEILLSQNGVCDICKNENGAKKLGVDHCHRTGNIRGLLCDSCNKGLGMFRDNPDLLRRAIDYLSREGMQTTRNFLVKPEYKNGKVKLVKIFKDSSGTGT